MNSDGILLINKPKGWSSFDVVAKVRNQLKNELGRKVKVGHTGTLDPLATGLMILVIGSYCKRAADYSKLDKVYEVTMRLGQTSTTGDEEGEKSAVSDRIPTHDEVKGSLVEFEGEIMQTPPVFSAIKIGGKRAYELARAGKEVRIEPRKVTIYDIEMGSYEYPFVEFLASVSSGTYIRSLVQDVGQRLETGAYMSDLVRTSVADFQLSDAIDIPDAEISAIKQ